jgi:hypothetical protein
LDEEKDLVTERLQVAEVRDKPLVVVVVFVPVSREVRCLSTGVFRRLDSPLANQC